MPLDTLFAVAFRIDPGGPIVVLGVRVDVAGRCVVRFDHLTSIGHGSHASSSPRRRPRPRPRPQARSRRSRRPRRSRLSRHHERHVTAGDPRRCAHRDRDRSWFEVVDTSLIEADAHGLTVSGRRALPHGVSLVVVGRANCAGGWRLARRAVVPNEPEGEMHLRCVPPDPVDTPA